MAPRVVPKNRIPDIVGAAIRVFGTKGFRQAPVDEIAKEANISPATLYGYFEGKTHLFVYVMENGGLVEEGRDLPAPRASVAKNERDLLEVLLKRIKSETWIKSIERYLKLSREDIDLTRELSDILEEVWDICRGNKVPLSLLVASRHEFPELEEIYERDGIRNMLNQIEGYLTTRMDDGVISPLKSATGMARLLMESMSWFAWKQMTASSPPHLSKSEVIPDLVFALVNGWRLPKPMENDKQ